MNAWDYMSNISIFKQGLSFLDGMGSRDYNILSLDNAQVCKTFSTILCKKIKPYRMVNSTMRLLNIFIGLLVLVLGNGCSLATSSGNTATGIDVDPNLSPTADGSYYNVPSVKLGQVYGTDSTGNPTVTFNYWNPSVSSVRLCLYTGSYDDINSPAATVVMSNIGGRVWSTGAIAVPSYPYYSYRADSTYVLDPYAKSMAKWKHNSFGTIGGDSVGKGAIIDPTQSTPDGTSWANAGTSSAYFDGTAMLATDGSSSSSYSYSDNRDAIIYEAGVRDLTVDPNLSFSSTGHTWGTYKALVDMLPHIQKLGVTHVQLLCPLQNYNYDQELIGSRETSTNLTTGANYNWGYDPQNYFTPTGMYSSDPGTPATRVNELMTLVNEVHKKGMGVIIDVVFNHTANNNILDGGTLSGYYYRSTSNNGAGSNDVRTESKMMRKLIIDALVYWTRVYKVDGFRFDLMGDIDAQTIKSAYQAVHDINPKTIFVGEGWTGYINSSSTDYAGNAVVGADQAHSTQFSGLNVSMFSDSFRNIFKNGYPSDGSPAFLTGTAQDAAALRSNICGVPSNSNVTFAPGSTRNVVSYLTCHDNLCLYDVIRVAGGSSNVLNRARLAFAVMMTSQGVGFIHAGDEMFRTKAASGSSNTKTGNGFTASDNSYNASDAVNQVGWVSNSYAGTTSVYSGDPVSGGFTNYNTSGSGYLLYKYAQGLISLRKSTNAFRLPDGYSGNISWISGSGTTSTYAFSAASTNGTGTYYVYVNASSAGWSISPPNGAALVVSDTASGTATLGTSSGSATVPAYSCYVYKN